MKQIYSKSSLTLGTKFLSNTIKTLLILFSLLAFTGNAWGKYSFTWTAKTAVGKGTGTAEVTIRTSSIASDKSESTSGSTLVEVKHTESSKIGSGVLVLKRYAEFTATPSTGYHFVGWYTNAACTQGEKTANSYSTSSQKPSNNGTSNLGTYYAKFELNTYKVKFNANGGSGSMNDQSFTYSKAQNLTANAFTKTGYVFLYWNTKSDGTGTTYTNQQSVNNLTTTNDGTVNLYAIWGRLTANTPAAGGTTAFGDVTVTKTSDWKSYKINHLRAGTVTLTQTGDTEDFFVASTSAAPENEFSQFSSSTTDASRTIYVQFRPTVSGERKCTLTVSCNQSGLQPLTYYFKGYGYSTPTITWVDGNGNLLTNGETTLSAGDILRASCISEQVVSYSDYDTSYFTEGTDDSGNPILIVRDDITGTIKDVTVTGNLAKNTTTFYGPYSETFTLNITNLIPQTIHWTNELSDLTNENMPYTVKLNAVAKNAKTGANSGQAITYSMPDNEYMSLSGNILTINKVGGPITITATAAESETYAPASVNRKATVINITDPCAPYDSHDDFSITNIDLFGKSINPVLPEKLSFTVKRGGLGSLMTKPGLVITQYNNNYDELKEDKKSYNEISTSGTNFTIDCDINATIITFSMSSAAAISYDLSNIKTTRVTSCTPDQTSISYSSEPEELVTKPLKLSYCNALVFLSFKSDEEANKVGTSLWSLNTTRIGGCGKKGEEFVEVSFRGHKKGDYNDKLYIRDNVGNLLSTVDLSATVTVRPQHLDTWNIASTYNTTDQTTLTAKTEEGRSNFDFIVQSSNPEGIVSISNTGVMTFNGSGTARIVAHESGGGIYDEFTSEPYDITVNKVTPAISANPTATVTYNGTFANNLLTDGKAEVTLRGVEHTEVGGHFEWVNVGTTVADAAGTHDYNVKFVPDNSSMYNTTDPFAISVTVNRAQSAIAMNNSSVDVSVSGAQASTLDLSTLIDSQTGDEATVTYNVTSDNAEHVTINGNSFFANAADIYTLTATRAQTDYYESATSEPFTVMVNKITPNINLSAVTTAAINYGQTLADATFGGIVTFDGTSVSEDVTNQFAWANSGDKPGVGTTTATATFTSTHTEWFNAVENVPVAITVNPIATTYAATTTITVGQSLSEAQFENTTTGLNDETVAGQIAWGDQVNTSLTPEAGNYQFAINFTSENANYTNGTGICYVTVIEGVIFDGTNGNWDEADNWSGDQVPGATDRVIINADVELSELFSVAGLTINAGNTVTIKDGGALNVGDMNSLDRETYGNIIVEAGGQLNLTTGAVKVNDFTLYSGYEGGQPKSGQVDNAGKLHPNGHAYFVLDLDPAGQASQGWYGFTVPFQVNALTGLARSADGINWDTNLKNEVNYAIETYHEDLRAQGQNGWKKYTGIMQPGVHHLITVDCEINRYRFEMIQGGVFNTADKHALQATTIDGGNNIDKGWNGLGNGTMQYISLPDNKIVQVLVHKAKPDNSYYTSVLTDTCKFAVGAAYFYQAAANGEMSIISANGATIVRAPQRDYEEENRLFGLTLSQSGCKCDNLTISCDDEATDEYTIGKDVQKMGSITGTSIARLWTNAKGTNLCAVNKAYVNDQAIIPLCIYAPKTGEYTLSLNDAPADVYLTRNGIIVWNLSMSEYTFDLNAGTDDTYALQVVRRVQNVATGIDATNNNGTIFAEKMIVNGQLFILRDGVLYDAQGKKVSSK